MKAGRASVISLVILILFLFAGEALLKRFNTDIASFAIAGALALFALAVEMTFNIELFRNDSVCGHATLVPVVFPLIAGSGTLTTALSLRAECHVENIILAISLSMVFVYFVLKKLYFVKRSIGNNGIYVLRKLFGVILLAMSVKLFSSNLKILIT